MPTRFTPLSTPTSSSNKKNTFPQTRSSVNFGNVRSRSFDFRPPEKKKKNTFNIPTAEEVAALGPNFADATTLRSTSVPFTPQNTKEVAASSSNRTGATNIQPSAPRATITEPRAKENLALSKSGRYGITPSGDQFDLQTGKKLTPQESQALGLNTTFLTKIDKAPGTVDDTKLTGSDFKDFFERTASPEAVESAQTELDAAEQAEQRAFDEGQAGKRTLLKESDQLFNQLFNSGEVKASQDERQAAIKELGRIDEDEIEAINKVKGEAIPSWAAAGQIQIIQDAFAGERAKAATKYALANDSLEQAQLYATQAYNHSLNQLEAKIGFLDDTLNRAKDLTANERTNLTETRERAMEFYKEKKAEAKEQNDLYIQLAQAGVEGLSPDMTIDQMSKLAGPELISRGKENRALELEAAKLENAFKRASIAKTNKEIEKVNKEIQDIADRNEALNSEDILEVLRASAGGKAATDSFKNSFEKGVNVVFQLDDLADAVDGEATDPIWGIIRSKNPYDAKAQQIQAQLTAIVPNLARGVYGEVGVLTDNDIKLYSQTLPNLKSTEEVRSALLGITMRSVQRSLETKLRVQAGAGVDVSGQEYVYRQVKETADNLLNPVGLASGSGGGTESIRVGEIRVQDSKGNKGFVPIDEFDPSVYTPI